MTSVDEFGRRDCPATVFIPQNQNKRTKNEIYEKFLKKSIDFNKLK